MGLPGYFSSPREKVGKGVCMEQENVLANAEHTKKTPNPKNHQALGSWGAKCLSAWT